MYVAVKGVPLSPAMETETAGGPPSYFSLAARGCREPISVSSILPTPRRRKDGFAVAERDWDRARISNAIRPIFC